VVHWDAVNTTQPFELEYSTDNGSSWTNITTVAVGTHFYDWAVPNEISGKGLIKVSSGSFVDIRDATFSIALSPVTVKVIQVCDTSATFEWQTVDDAESYDLYILGEKYMEVAGNSNTNTVTVPITDPTKPIWFTVTAKNDTEGWVGPRPKSKFYAGGLLDCTVGIAENTLNDSVSMYPNPATNEVFI